MIQSAFPSFYDQKREFSSSWRLKKILSDFFDAKSVSEMKIFSYAFSFSESISRVYSKKQKIIGKTSEIRMSSQKDRKDTVFVFELQKFSAHNTKKRRTQHTCAQHTNTAFNALGNYHATNQQKSKTLSQFSSLQHVV
jgi:hypothetical protein